MKKTSRNCRNGLLMADPRQDIAAQEMAQKGKVLPEEKQAVPEKAKVQQASIPALPGGRAEAPRQLYLHEAGTLRLQKAEARQPRPEARQVRSLKEEEALQLQAAEVPPQVAEVPYLQAAETHRRIAETLRLQAARVWLRMAEVQILPAPPENVVPPAALQ